MLCQCCFGAGAVLGLSKPFPTQPCWPCESTGVTPDGRLGPAEIRFDSVRMAKSARKMVKRAQDMGLIPKESDIFKVNVSGNPDDR